MPSEQSHIATANSNHDTLKFIFQDIEHHLPWIGVIAFYKALHVVDAVLAKKHKYHPTTHGERISFLARENSLKSLFDHFQPLRAMSEKARYLSFCKDNNDVARFQDHISKQEMVDHYLKHRLHKVEQSASNHLSGIESVMTIFQK